MVVSSMYQLNIFPTRADSHLTIGEVDILHSIEGFLDKGGNKVGMVEYFSVENKDDFPNAKGGTSRNGIHLYQLLK